MPQTPAQRRWYLENRGRILAKRKASYDAEPERYRQKTARYRRANALRARELVDRWHAEHPDRVREIKRVGTQTRRCRLTAGVGVTTADWDAICERQGGLCAYCGGGARLTMDHVIPLCKGGAHDPSNVVGACWPCNHSKRGRSLEEFLKETA
jgi:5-methylcytosine-specific restriction endonuclease McrA